MTDENVELSLVVVGIVDQLIREKVSGRSAVKLTSQTLLTRELDMESIDFVLLVERLANEFGSYLRFADWLATLDYSEFATLRIADIANFVGAELDMQRRESHQP